MTIEQAIKHAEEVAEEKNMQAGFDTDYLCYQMSDTERNQCKKCAEEHRQLAEWLKELKQLREQTMTERKTIYLDDAIETIRKLPNAGIHWFVSVEEVFDVLLKLPSAQLEIIRCKDCKHYACILYSGTQFEYGECFGHEESDYTFEVKPDDFCSRAERKDDDCI